MEWRSTDHERAREDRAARGLAAWIDTDRSMQWYKAGDARRQGILRRVILKTVWTKARRAKMPNNDPDPTCDCGVEKGDAGHLWWRCGRWAHVRRKHESEALPYDEFSIAFTDLGLKLNSDPKYQYKEFRRSLRFMNLERVLSDSFWEKKKGKKTKGMDPLRRLHLCCAPWEKIKEACSPN